MYIDVTALSHIGRKKDKNEDSFGVFDDREPGLRLFRQGMLMAVADGLGGHVGGRYRIQAGGLHAERHFKRRSAPGGRYRF